MPPTPHNKNKLMGSKKALTLDQVRAIKTVLAQRGSTRDRALFSLAIDSSLRGYDLLRLAVSDVSAQGQIKEAVRVRPTKTKESSGETVVFEPIDYTRQLLRELIDEADKTPADFLFVRSRKLRTPLPYQPHLSERAYQNLVKVWVGMIGLNPELYGTHSLRRSRPAYIYEQTKNLRACQKILGHSKITSTQLYLGIEEAEALEIARGYQM